MSASARLNPRHPHDTGIVSPLPAEAPPLAPHPLWSPAARIVIEHVSPELDAGRYPVKRTVGETLAVTADIFRDGHDVLGAHVRYRPHAVLDWRTAPLSYNYDQDRWSGRVPLDQIGRLMFTIEAWTDVFASWRRDLLKKLDAEQDVSTELVEGRQILEQATAGSAAMVVRPVIAALTEATPPDELRRALLDERFSSVMEMVGPRADTTLYPRHLEVVVDRPRATFAAWYEMFTRSQGTDPHRSATFEEAMRRLPEIKAMGFDVVYLVPIHPIGYINRKGPNNTLNPGPDDPGSPYAIGNERGGHEAVDPDLGTVEDFERFVARCHELDMEVALDFAIQCAPDHLWVKQHPEWFTFLPDGSIKYAENPPKKYQDIVNVNFYGPHREALWNALRDVVLVWVGRGVKTFRVDNPHTKPVPFWEWLIWDVQRRHPDVIFLSEAFTRPKMLQKLAKVGFTQSYTYFTWRTTKQELTDYLTELTQTELAEYLRPNFFANTPDILSPFLQNGGPPAFKIRLVLAATLAGVYGIYNGYELCENRGIPGTEEYADSEKYQFKVWDWDRPGHIKPYITQVNRIRRDNPAFRAYRNLRFWRADDDNVLFYGRMTDDRSSMVFVAVNLDPFAAHETTLWFPITEMGLRDPDAWQLEELLTGVRETRQGSPCRMRLDPDVNPAVIYRAAAIPRT